MRALLDTGAFLWFISDSDRLSMNARNCIANLDFLCEIQGSIHPLEAKAGISPKSKSLLSYDTQFNPPVLFRTTLLNLKKDGKICNIPLYAVHNFPEIMDVDDR